MYNNVKRYEPILSGAKFREKEKQERQKGSTSPYSEASNLFDEQQQEQNAKEIAKQQDDLQKKIICLQNRKRYLMKTLPSNLMQKLPVDLIFDDPTATLSGGTKAITEDGSAAEGNRQDNGLSKGLMGSSGSFMKLHDKYRANNSGDTRRRQQIYEKLLQIERADKAQLLKFDARCKQFTVQHQKFWSPEDDVKGEDSSKAMFN